MMNKLLTIDWDYFIDVSLKDRTDTFPPVTNGELSYCPDNSLWDNVSCKMKLFRRDFERLLSSIYLCGTFNRAFVSENHGEVYNVFKECGGFSEIVNIDFHHDLYIGSSRLCCDNWCTLLKKDYDFNYYWVKRPDSVTTTFGEEVDALYISFNSVLRLIETGYFDTIHLCRSDLYSPPAFDKEFEKLKNLIKSKTMSFNTLGSPLKTR